jgi:hypothetical protein
MQDNPLNSGTAAVIMQIWISVRRYSRENLWSAKRTPISPSFLLNCNKGLGVQIRLRCSAPRVDPRICRACLPSTDNTLAHSIATESTVQRQSTLRDSKSRSKYRKRRKESCELYVRKTPSTAVHHKRSSQDESTQVVTLYLVAQGIFALQAVSHNLAGTQSALANRWIQRVQAPMSSQCAHCYSTARLITLSGPMSPCSDPFQSLLSSNPVGSPTPIKSTECILTALSFLCALTSILSGSRRSRE